MQLEKPDWTIASMLPEIDRLPPDWALIPIGNAKRPPYSGWETSEFKAIDFHRAASSGVFKGAMCGAGGESPYEMPERYCRAVGVLCGKPSGGLLFLDHDGRSCDPLIEKLAGCTRREAIPRTAVVSSGKPGRYQAIYRVPERYWPGISTRKVSTGEKGPDGKGEALEFRWSGAQSVVLGHHPETGSYRWVYHPAEVEIAEAPLWMIEQMLEQEDEPAPLLSLVPSPGAAPQPALQRLPRWRDYDSNFRLPVDSVIPLDVAIAPSTRKRLAGDYETGRNDAGIAIAADLIGTASHLQTLGQRFSGDPEQIFFDWCRSVGLDQDEPKGQPKGIWKSAQKGSKGAALSPEMIEGCIKTWSWKQLKASFPGVVSPAPEPRRLEVAPLPEESESTAANLRAAVEELCAEEDEFQRAILEVRIGTKFKVRGSRLAELCSVVQAPKAKEAERVSQLLPGYYEKITDYAENHTRGYLTNLTRVDEILGGLSTQTTVLVAARPGMGKTTLAQHFVTQFAEKYQQGVAIFSLEMDKDSLLDKFVSAKTKIPYSKFRSRTLSEAEQNQIQDPLTEIHGWPLVLDDSSGLTIEKLKRKAFKIAKDFKADGISLKCLVVDHVGLIKGPKSESRALEVSAISKALLEIAKELDCVVIILSQLNRGVESRNDKHPLLSDLKDSGSLEEDATQVLLIYRDDYYNPYSPDRGIAEINIAKNRHGPTGMGKALFDGEHSAFVSI
jgi:replicative DNA helicase